MEYIRLGNFEAYSDTINWSVPGERQEYFGSPQKYLKLLDDEDSLNLLLESKIGKGWRIPTLNEMKYIGDLSWGFRITKSKKFHLPTFYNYIVKETVIPSNIERDINRKTFFNLENGSPNPQPWIPGFFLTNSGKRNFLILPVRDS